MDLFESAGTDDAGIPVDSHAPLAVRMRPRTLDELQGQAHLLTPGSPLRRLVEPAEASGGKYGERGLERKRHALCRRRAIRTSLGHRFGHEQRSLSFIRFILFVGSRNETRDGDDGR